jgi:hypothetical protein
MAFADVMARHEVLRTVFPADGDRPFQRVLPPGDAASDLPVTEASEQGLRDAIAEIAERPFDLSAEPPIRAVLLRIAPDSHVLTIVIHHIASDAWSMGLLARDISRAYAARCQNQAPDWEPLPVQYADYALWQRESLGEEDDPDSVISQQIAYWRQALDGVPRELTLVFDRARPEAPSYRAHLVPLTIPADLHEQLTAVASANGVTMFMVLHAALAILLSKLGGGQDITVGSPVAGRTDEALDDLVGFFINNVVLRTSLSGNPTFAELLSRVKETSMGALAHQDVPFERLVEVLAPARSPGLHPLYQVVLAVQNTAKAVIGLPGVRSALQPAVTTASATVDLDVNLGEVFDDEGRPAGLRGSVTVAADVFDQATAEHFAERIVRVLAAAAADPRIRVSAIKILDTTERQQMLTGWNDAPRETLS